MSTEYYSLAIMTLFFLFAWTPVSLGKVKGYGFKYLASNRSYTPKTELPAWAARCDRAYNNLKDYFPAFVVAILLLGTLNKFDNSTATAAIIYTVVRILHYVSYGVGFVPGRALFFFTGLFANTYLLLKIFL